MPDTQKNIDVITKLQMIRNAAEQAQITLAANGKTTEVAQAGERIQLLRTHIGVLIGRVMLDWANASRPQTVKLGLLADRVNRSVAELQRDVSSARKVVQLLGYLDDAIRFAARLLA